LKIANLAQDGKMLEIARSVALEILETDPQLEANENRVLGNQLKKMKTNTLNWGSIS